MTARKGFWDDFVARLAAHKMSFADDMQQPVKEGETVELRCLTHPHASVEVWDRKKLSVWMSPNTNGKARKLLSPCHACACESKTHLEDSQAAGREKTRLELNARLAVFGWTLDLWNGSTYRDETGKIKPQKSKVRCLHCNTVTEFFVLPSLQKWEKARAAGKTVNTHCR